MKRFTKIKYIKYKMIYYKDYIISQKENLNLNFYIRTILLQIFLIKEN